MLRDEEATFRRSVELVAATAYPTQLRLWMLCADSYINAFKSDIDPFGSTEAGGEFKFASGLGLSDVKLSLDLVVTAYAVWKILKAFFGAKDKSIAIATAGDELRDCLVEQGLPNAKIAAIVKDFRQRLSDHLTAEAK